MTHTPTDHTARDLDREAYVAWLTQVEFRLNNAPDRPVFPPAERRPTKRTYLMSLFDAL